MLISSLYCLFLSLLWLVEIPGQDASDCQPRMEGFRGIWFDLGQRSEYGSKYSGGLGTYTAKHRPLAIHAPSVRRTFFVYGGTTDRDRRHLLALASYYDHDRRLLAQPVIVHDKGGVNDPHDNPSLTIDGKGHLWIFVSGRGRSRPGFIYRSRSPYSIDCFDQVAEGEFTYPQPWWISLRGLLHLFTKYTDGRELYWNRSDQGGVWTPARKLAGMGGHYQMSIEQDGRVATAFNMHPEGEVDRRTNLYYVETHDFGETWMDVRGRRVDPPLTDNHTSALVRDYRAENRLVYLKDMIFDRAGNPLLLVITSEDHRPGPHKFPRQWTLASYSGDSWDFSEITQASHNYDMGSLFVKPDGRLKLIAPTGTGPQPYGTGGEIELWESADGGIRWERVRTVTRGSERNHGYVRIPRNAHPDFFAFWADGNPEEMSISNLYFTNARGDRVWMMPYEGTSRYLEPVLLRTPSRGTEEN